MVARGFHTIYGRVIQDLGPFSWSVAEEPKLSAGGKPDRIRTSGAKIVHLSLR